MRITGWICEFNACANILWAWLPVGNTGGERTLSSNLRCAMTTCDVLTQIVTYCRRGERTMLHFAKHPLKMVSKLLRCGTRGTPQAACWQPPYWCHLPSSLVSPWLSCLSPPLVFWPKMPQDKNNTFCYHRAMIFTPPFVAPPSVPVWIIIIIIFIIIIMIFIISLWSHARRPAVQPEQAI